MEPWEIEDKPGSGMGVGRPMKESTAGNTPQQPELSLEKAPTPEEEACFYARYIVPVGRFTKTKIAPAAGTTLKYGAKAAGKAVRHLSPFIPAGAALGFYVHFRDDIAELIDQNLIPDAGFRLDDPARGLGQTEKSLAQLTENMPVEEELGVLREEYDVGGEIEQIRTILREIDDDYNTLEANGRRITHAVVEHTTTFAVRIGDVLIAPVEATAEMLGLNGIIESLRDVNDMATYNAVRPYLEPQVQARMNQEMDQGHSLAQALQNIVHERNELEFQERVDVGQRESQRCIDGFLDYLHSIGDTNQLQMDTAELVEGYGNVVEAALIEYQQTRDPQALEQISQYVSSDETFRQLETMIVGPYSEQHAQVSILLRQLEDLTANVQDRRETLQWLRDIYFNLGDLRQEYQTVGQRFAPEEQSSAIARIDVELERAEDLTNAAVSTARRDEEYLAVNPMPREPSGCAYGTTDAVGIGLTVVIGCWGAKNYVGRGIQVLKRAIFKKTKD